MDNGGGNPADPMTAMAQASATLHEVYLSYVAAGFSASQALYLCGQILRATLAQGQAPDD